ncbi:MAG: hypothetical protein LBV04_10480 [Deferribacteraceae bacterium]|jgi:hypothetical protein|nr:hypothetical protein [Deferribacteraceae bacterium]
MFSCYRERVQAFWKWFEANEPKLADYVDNMKNYDADEVVAFFSEGLNIAIDGCTFNVGGDREVTITPEGSYVMAFLTTYLVNSMPSKLKENWNFFPWKTSFTGGALRMHDKDITAEDILVSVEEEDGRFGIEFYNDTLAEIDENQAYQIFYMMLDLSLGENISMGFINWVDKAEAKKDGMIPLSELRQYISDHHAEPVDDDYSPTDRWITYSGKPSQDADLLRYDIIAGHSCLRPLLEDYYSDEDAAYELFKQNGVKAAFLAIERPEGENYREIIDAFADKIEEELLGLAGSGSEIGVLIGGATGEEYSYVDLLIYDEAVFSKALSSFLTNSDLQVQYCDFVARG